jgi:hypothetical protein
MSEQAIRFALARSGEHVVMAEQLRTPHGTPLQSWVGRCSCGYRSRPTAFPGYAERRALDHAAAPPAGVTFRTEGKANE